MLSVIEHEEILKKKPFSERLNSAKLQMSFRCEQSYPFVSGSYSLLDIHSQLLRLNAGRGFSKRFSWVGQQQYHVVPCPIG